jgi:hypothetical protein
MEDVDFAVYESGCQATTQNRFPCFMYMCVSMTFQAKRETLCLSTTALSTSPAFVNDIYAPAQSKPLPRFGPNLVFVLMHDQLVCLHILPNAPTGPTYCCDDRT